MNNREQYKRMLNFLANAVILFFQGMCFAYIWYEYYSRVIFMPFFRRGNWAVVGMYVLILFFFTRVMGGYKVGYLRISDICLSQLLAILASNVIGYLQICMIGRDYMPIGPIIMITWAEILFVVPWAYTVRWLFVRLYPPRKMLIIYGKYSPDDLIKKVNSRRDKYNICGAESIAIGYEELTKRIPDYEAVVLCDLPAHTRNKILKFCFEKSIRIYVTPKLSDIIISGSESIHLFDTPLYLCRNNGFSMDQRIFKRAMDIIGSLIGIIILSPFMLLTACLLYTSYHSIRQTQNNLFKNGLVGVCDGNGVNFPPFDKLADTFGFRYFKIDSLDGIEEKLQEVLNTDGPVLCEAILDEAQNFAPKLSSKVLPDGKIVSPPIDDMFPFLDRAEYQANKLQ